eukprot:gene18563-26231_t
MASQAIFSHRNYSLVNNDRIVRNPVAPPLTAAENDEILTEVARYIEEKLVKEYGFGPIQIPEDEEVSTTILASPDIFTSTKLLIIVQNSYGSQLGMFSRSTVMEQGISKGSWIPYIEQAIVAGYAVLMLNPNSNSVTVGKSKVLIKGSESPEIHALAVWENVVPRAENVNHIALLGYGNGASLCKDLFLRAMVNSDGPSSNKIKAFITIEA